MFEDPNYDPPYNSIWWRLRRAFRSVYNFLRYDLHQGIEQCWAWFPIIWRTRDWDWDWLAEIMEFKLRRMADGIEKHGHLVSNGRNVKQMRVCATILKRLRQDEYDPYLPGGKMSKLSLERANLQKKEELRLLFRTMEKHMLGWWD